MKLLVLGATGGIGLEILQQAIQRGHEVTAFVRTPGALQTFGNRVAVVQGDLLDRCQLKRALEGHDAVLSGFGPRTPIARRDADLLRRFAPPLTGAMQQAGVRRLVLVSTAFLFRDSILPPAWLVGRLFFRDLVADALGMEEVIRKNPLDWTIVRPPRLVDKPRAGRYRVREGHLPLFGFKISRADVADFMIRTAETGAHNKQVAGVSD